MLFSSVLGVRDAELSFRAWGYGTIFFDVCCLRRCAVVSPKSRIWFVTPAGRYSMPGPEFSLFLGVSENFILQNSR